MEVQKSRETSSRFRKLKSQKDLCLDNLRIVFGKALWVRNGRLGTWLERANDLWSGAASRFAAGPILRANACLCALVDDLMRLVTMTRSHAPMPSDHESDFETDTRFPSGPWCGFFLMSHLPGRHQMELQLAFRRGAMSGEGRDLIGSFLIRGKYSVESGECWWTKRYIGKHDVYYHGYNEGKGIWGLWEIPPNWKGGFHIWPEAMGDPTRRTLANSVDEPVAVIEQEESEVAVETGVGVGVGELVPMKETAE